MPIIYMIIYNRLLARSETVKGGYFRMPGTLANRDQVMILPIIL